MGNEVLSHEIPKDREAVSLETVLKPYQYISTLPGKNIREKLAIGFNKWFKVPEERFEAVCGIISTLHNASLIIDDIEDSSDLRRGFPSTHKVFGVPLSINAANCAYIVALKDVIKLGNIKAVEIYTNQMLSLHEGQGMEIYWRDFDGVPNPPTELQYEDIVVKKASGLFHMLVQLLQLDNPAEDKRDFKPIVSLMGLYFQMRDDYQNLCSKEYESSKGYCEDLTEGKYSYPLIHAMNSGDEKVKDRIGHILKLKTSKLEVKMEVIKILEDVGSLEYTRHRLNTLQTQLLNLINSLGGNHILEQFITKLLSF